MEHGEYIKNEEVSQRQRPRALWAQGGDKNTNFFRKVANDHKRNSNIDQLVIQDEQVEDPVGIKGGIFDFYRKLYSETRDWRPSCNFIICPVITEVEKEALQRDFDEQEEYTCLDGYTMCFFIKCWEVLKQDNIKTFKNFHSHGVIEKKFNTTYIALIPKKTGAKDLRELKPISLIGSMYKLLPKVLTERLKRVIRKLVDAQHMAFIEECQNNGCPNCQWRR